MFRNYFKIAFRNLWKHRGFSFLNILGLAIGMTAGFLILLYVAFELSYDKFHAKSDTIYRVIVDIKTPSELIEGNRPAWAVPKHLEQEFEEVVSAVRIMNLAPIVRKDEIKFQETLTIAADSAFFEVFDFELVQGDAENVLVEPYTMVLSETSAQKYFGQQNPIGKTLLITEDALPIRVTGIMKDIPENSHIQATMVLSITTFTESLNPGNDDRWDSYNPAAYVLLNPNTDPKLLESKFPDFLERNTGENMRESKMFVTLFLEPFKDVYLKSTRGGNGNGSITNVYIFSIVALFILLIACINFINLTTARSVERAKEVGIRKVVGAEKAQLGLQFIGESIIISLFAFVLTIVLTGLFLPSFNSMAGKVISEGIFSNPAYPLILLAISLGIGVLAGVYPAFVLSSFKPVSVLKGSFSTGTQGVFLRKGLVIAQFTISIALIIGTLIIYNQMRFMRNQELGFNKEQTIVLEVNPSPAQTSLKIALNDLPGVTSTSLGSAVPGGGNNGAYSEIENKSGEMQVANLAAYFVDYDYISQFDLKIVAGRGFSKGFVTDSTEAMVLNEKAVQLLGYSSPEEALGAKFDQWGRAGQIVGVVKDFHFRSLQENIKPLTMRIEPNMMDLVTVKVSPAQIQQTVAAIENVWQTILPASPFNYYFLDEFFDRQYRTEERFGNLFLNFAILAILISCLGLLGLAAYSTLQRKREIGIRKVIGSSIFGIVKLLSKEFLKLVGIAFFIAMPLAWLIMGQWLKDFAYRIDMQWWIFALAGASAILIALLTVSFHAVKASLANPVKSLRTE
jgi:putative ABC transport system permease protein